MPMKGSVDETYFNTVFFLFIFFRVEGGGWSFVKWLMFFLIKCHMTSLLSDFGACSTFLPAFMKG